MAFAVAVDDILIRACVLFEHKHAIYGCTGTLKSVLETSHYSSSGVGKEGSELCHKIIYLIPQKVLSYSHDLPSLAVNCI